jgi:long-chain fatty acid transport protein
MALPDGDGGMRNRKNYLLSAVALSALVLASADAQAGGFALREQSAVGAGDAFAGEGTTGMGLSAMFWNPAAVTQERGVGFEIGTTFIMPTSKKTVNSAFTSPSLNTLEFGPNQQYSIGEPGIVPTFYMATRLDQNWFVGLAIDAPYGLAINQGPRGQASEQLGNSASIASIEANPIIGYKFNDMVSVAAGPRVTYVKANFNRSLFGLPPFGNFDTPVQTDLSDVGLGFTAGITVKPWSGTELSLGYRSQEHLKLAGTAFFVPNAVLLAAPPTAPFNGITTQLTSGETLPDQVNFGVSQQVTDTFKLLGTIEWTHWSLLNAGVPLTFTSGPAPGTTADTLNLFFRDGWFFSLGGEYKWDAQTTVRAGIGYEISPVTDQFRDINIPDSNRWMVSTGLTRYLGKGITLDFGYSYIWFQDAPINVGPGNPDQTKLITLIPGVFNSYGADVRTHVQIASVSLRKELLPDVVTAKGANLVKAPIMPAVYDWNGFYVGANGGYSFGRAETDLTFPGAPVVSGHSNINGMLAGGQAGYNWQFNPKWVFGVEGDLQWARQSGELDIIDGPFCVTPVVTFGLAPTTCTSTTASLEQRLAWFGTGRLRLGVLPAPEWMLYATGGVAFGEIQNSVSIVNQTTSGIVFPGVPPSTVTASATAAGSANNDRIGWTIGAGTEFVLHGAWTGKFEYLYVDYGTFSNTYTVAGAPVLTTSTHMIDNVLRLGLNYHFGGPVVAKY